MRWKEIILEDIDQTIMLDAYRACRDAINKFINDEFPTYIRALDGDELFEKLAELEAERKKYYEDDNWKEADRLSDHISNIQSDITSLEPGFQKNERNELIERFLHTLELALQKVASEEVEKKYGPIHKYDPHATNFDDIFEENLYFLQHIVVKFEINAMKYGRPQTGGGYFRDMVQNGEFDTPYTKGIDFSNVLSSGIKIFVDHRQVGAVLSDEFKKKLDIKFYGEAYRYENQIDKFLKTNLGVFVHEYVHLLQHIERTNSQQAAKKIGNFKKHTNGSTYLPNPGESRKKYQKYVPGKGYQYFKAGKKGNSDRLGGEGPPDEKRYESYFGTSHEIEAHAHGAASEMIAEFLNSFENSRRWGNEKYQQSELNYAVDSIINDLKYGDATNIGSFRSYTDYVKAKIKSVDQQIGKPLPKADVLHRKVWRIFMTKLVKALLLYKKDIPEETWD